VTGSCRSPFQTPRFSARVYTQTRLGLLVNPPLKLLRRNPHSPTDAHHRQFTSGAKSIHAGPSDLENLSRVCNAQQTLTDAGRFAASIVATARAAKLASVIHRLALNSLSFDLKLVAGNIREHVK
jgi:hypothetical protein